MHFTLSPEEHYCFAPKISKSLWAHEQACKESTESLPHCVHGQLLRRGSLVWSLAFIVYCASTINLCRLLAKSFCIINFSPLPFNHLPKKNIESAFEATERNANIIYCCDSFRFVLNMEPVLTIFQAAFIGLRHAKSCAAAWLLEAFRGVKLFADP